MSSKGGYSAAPPRQDGDRFYNPPAVRRHQQVLQQQQTVQPRPLLQQKQKQKQQQQQQQHELQRRELVKAESSSAAAQAEKRSDGDDRSMTATLSAPRSGSSASTSSVTNLDRLMESVTPFIQTRHKSEVTTRDSVTGEVEPRPFFYLEDLWESFSEWSVYGAGVPLLLNGKDRIEQYYVPFLSGLQLYIDPLKPSSRLGGSSEESDPESCKLTSRIGNPDLEGERRAKPNLNLKQQPSRLSSGDKAVINSASSEYDSVPVSPGLLLFQYLEYEQPYNRRPLIDRISLLSSSRPELSKYRSCDLLPTSWMSVAWYPIYRIPVGPTLQDLDASFLTFHSLSTQSRSDWPPQFHVANAKTVHNGNPTSKISLPVFALASYKLKGSILSPCGPHECEQENSLLQRAENWLQCLQVILPDYQFFRTHHSHRR